jgi:hypothetical protein
MSDSVRSTWLKMLLVFAMALLVAQCGSDNGDDGNGDGGNGEVECNEETLTAGTYSFSLTQDDCDDDCEHQGHGIAKLLYLLGEVLPGPYSIDLPSYQQLLAGSQPFNGTLPFVGTVNGILTLGGEVVGLTVQNPITVQDVGIPDIGLVDFTVTVVANFCTDSANIVDVEIIATITDTNPSIMGRCSMIFSATATR